LKQFHGAAAGQGYKDAKQFIRTVENESLNPAEFSLVFRGRGKSGLEQVAGKSLSFPERMGIAAGRPRNVSTI
jgi:hypothetical protein